MVQPRQDALVARHVGAVALGLFASATYLDQRGAPQSTADLVGHDLVGPDRVQADLAVADLLDPAITRASFTTRIDSHPAHFAAIRAGLGIGVVQRPVGLGHPDLRAVLPDLTIAELPCWIVMHEDLRRLPRVRAVFNHLVAEVTAFTRSA